MYAAVIIETRPIPLREVVKRHMDFLPEDWHLFVFTTQQNRAYIVSEVDAMSARICILTMPQFTEQLYNQLLTSTEFWTVFEKYNRVLIFQHDSGLLREGIEEFMEFDWVGSPWKFKPFRANGGLSLRNPKAMLELIGKQNYHSQFGNEDVYFCNLMIQHSYNLAPLEVCKKFACETIFELGTLGFHNIQKYLTPKEVTLILNQYHEAEKEKALHLP